MFHLASFYCKTGYNYVPRPINSIHISCRHQVKVKGFVTKNNGTKLTAKVDRIKSSIQAKKEAESHLKTLEETKRRMKIRNAEISKLYKEDPSSVQEIHISPEQWKKLIEQMKNALPDGSG